MKTLTVIGISIAAITFTVLYFPISKKSKALDYKKNNRDENLLKKLEILKIECPTENPKAEYSVEKIGKYIKCRSELKSIQAKIS